MSSGVCYLSTINNGPPPIQEHPLMTPSANRLLWKFLDTVVPTEWRSRQAKRMYEAAIAAEKSGAWIDHAVGGSVRCVSNQDDVQTLREPQFGTNKDDATIEALARGHIAALRRHADRIEATLGTYGAGAFRKRVAQMPAPRHPFEAEPALLALLRDDSIDEISIHGVRFVRDASRSFVQANAT